MFPYHQLLGPLLSKSGHGILDMCTNVSMCWAYKDKTDTHKSMQSVCPEKKLKVSSVYLHWWLLSPDHQHSALTTELQPMCVSFVHDDRHVSVLRSGVGVVGRVGGEGSSCLVSVVAL